MLIRMRDIYFLYLVGNKPEGKLMLSSSIREQLKYPQDVSERRTSIIDALNKALGVFCSCREATFDDVLTNALQPISEALGIDRLQINRRFDEGGKIRLKQQYRWKVSRGGMTVDNLIILPDNPALEAWISFLLEDQCVLRRLSGASELEADFMGSYGIKSIFLAPIFTHGEFWGCVIFQNTEDEKSFDDDFIDLMQASARICATAVIREDMAREIAEQNEITHVIFDAAPIGLAMFDENLNFIDCNEALLEMLSSSKDFFINHFHKLAPEHQPDGSRSVDKASDRLRRALNGERIVTEWVHCTPAGELIPTEVTLTRMLHKEKYFGLGYVYDLRAIKRMESNILRLKSESEKIYYDPLTGIFNRRFFDENLDRVMKTLSRSGGILSLMMIDVDTFKSFNDTRGHSAGDDCLKAVSECLVKSVTRADDFVVRYGGDEFAVVLPNTDEDGVRLLAEKMIENVRNRSIPHGKIGSARIVTISIGGTFGLVKNTHRAGDFIKRADELLYISKQCGRNRASFGGM